MTIQDVIERIRETKPNTAQNRDIIEWLSQVDHMVKRQIIDTHEGGEGVSFAGYDDNSPMDTVLLVPAPFNEMYLRYVEAQIEYQDMQEDRYNNAMDIFNQVWREFRNDYNRRHMPKSVKFKF